MTQKLNVWEHCLLTHSANRDCICRVRWGIYVPFLWVWYHWVKKAVYTCWGCSSVSLEEKRSFATAMKSVSLISEWKKYSDGWWKFKCTEMTTRPSIYAPCWILLGRTFCRNEGVFCPYRGSIEVLERL